ncbi:hypothetical protein K432DRAFT_8182 [Lepidopterella palustris CBS 459.81]|uniref:Uncharacterized protein n=1 Tax=Lepidopterella palustris CBS 459.81 TaxID=1314670 RepID=A0A8E2EDS4_9PEZI|nr:hypothetical protein K432DRAFT_8182 [Lepidopterella palustris CBS 459.81]
MELSKWFEGEGFGIMVSIFFAWHNCKEVEIPTRVPFVASSRNLRIAQDTHPIVFRISLQIADTIPHTLRLQYHIKPTSPTHPTLTTTSTLHLHSSLITHHPSPPQLNSLHSLQFHHIPHPMAHLKRMFLHRSHCGSHSVNSPLSMYLPPPLLQEEDEGNEG